MIAVRRQVLYDAAGVAGLVGGLVNRPASGKPAAKAMAASTPGALATYRSEEGEVVALLQVDLGFAAASGAALFLIPAGAVAHAVRRRTLDDMMWEGFHEVANVLSRAFTAMQAPRVVLTDVVRIPGPVPPTVGAVMRAGPQRLDLEIAITGYGPGLVTLLSV